MARSDAELNRQKILMAFTDLVRSDKQDAVPTMSDVVRHSGLGRGTVYRHYPDIGSLAFAVLNAEYQTLFRTTRTRLENVVLQPEIPGILEDHLKRSAELVLANRKLLLANECRISAGYARALKSMRAVIADILHRYSGRNSDDPVLVVYSDLIARSVEIGHLRDTENIHDLDLSVIVAMELAHRL